MALHADQTIGLRVGLSGARLRQRVLLVSSLLLLAIVLVVGTQNFDERASVHLLLWSFDLPLLVFFLGSVCLGALSAELVRVWRRRRESLMAPAARPAGERARG